MNPLRKMGSLQVKWDLLASAANVMKTPQGQKRMIRIGMVLNIHYLKLKLKHQKKDCVMIIPAINAPWVNL